MSCPVNYEELLTVTVLKNVMFTYFLFSKKFLPEVITSSSSITTNNAFEWLLIRMYDDMTFVMIAPVRTIFTNFAPILYFLLKIENKKLNSVFIWKISHYVNLLKLNYFSLLKLNYFS